LHNKFIQHLNPAQPEAIFSLRQKAVSLKISDFIATPFKINITLFRRKHMKNPLDSLWGTVISGLILTVVLYYVAINFLK